MIPAARREDGLASLGDDPKVDVAAIARIEAVPAILDVICHVTGMGFAAVARVTEDRWIACGVVDKIAFGLAPGDELRLDTPVRSDVGEHLKPAIIDSATEAKAFGGHPTPATCGFRSYVAAPIVLEDGSFFGSLCALDSHPAKLNTPEIASMFRLFAELIALHLMSSRLLAASEANLTDERATAGLREQFIAVLGHDLRNPLAAIVSGLRLLERTPLSDKARQVVGLMQSSVRRMGGLIDNVLDFARGRLGGGLTLERDAREPLAPVLDQVVAELQSSWPDRRIETGFDLPAPINCDRRRIGQLFSNLLANALTYGEPDTAVRAGGHCAEGRLELWVANSGEPIPTAARERLFEPFARGAVRPSQQGLGLGLYISSEIAQAHGGRLDVDSTAKETRFTFRMPI